jgi:hypothetical protein
VVYRPPSHLGLPGDGGLPPRLDALPVGVHEVPDQALEPRLEDDARQGQEGELAVVPAGYAADVEVRVGVGPAQLELLAPRGRARPEAVHGEARVLPVAQHPHLVPVAVAELPADGDDLRPAAEVVPQPEGALDELDLEEVDGAAVVGIEQQPVALLGLELELEAAVEGGVPLGEARVARGRAVEEQAARPLPGPEGQEGRRGEEDRPHVPGPRGRPAHPRGLRGEPPTTPLPPPSRDRRGLPNLAIAAARIDARRVAAIAPHNPAQRAQPAGVAALPRWVMSRWGGRRPRARL